MVCASVCIVERGRTGDAIAMMGVRESCGGWGDMTLLSMADSMVYSTLELV